MPEGFYALAEQVAKGPVPDVLTLHLGETGDATGGVALATAPPKTRFMVQADDEFMFEKQAASRSGINSAM